MSLEPSASDVSSRSLDLNSAALAHQEETDGSAEANKPWDFAPGNDLGGGLQEEDQNVMEAVEMEGIGEDFNQAEKSVGFSEESLKTGEEAPDITISIVDSDNVLEMDAAMPKAEEGGMSDSRHPSGDKTLVTEYNLPIDLKKDDSSGEVEEASKSEPVVEALAPLNFGQDPDVKLFQGNEDQECKSVYSFGDMVWGKVRSHPWWPGQIYHPSVSSDLALKYHKKDHFLIAYFGDNSFAWNDESQLKPFESCFPRMEKQSNLAAFVDAVDDSLLEFARRTEIGMTCACITDELISDLKYRVFENAGIIEGTCCPTLDQSLAASSFDPGRLLDYIQDLAQLPCEKSERLELVKVKAQLNAIYRSKGYPELPEFRFDGGILPNEAEVTTLEREETVKDDAEYKKEGILLDDTFTKEKRSRGRLFGKKKQIDEEGRKQKSLPELMKQTVDHSSLNGKKAKDGMASSKKNQIIEDERKPKSLPDVMKQTVDHSTLNGKKVKGGMLAAPNSSSKKRMISDFDSFDCGMSKKKRLKSLGDIGSMPASSSRMRAVKIGQRISQVANKMKFPRPFHKQNDRTLHNGKAMENRRTTSVHGSSKTPRKDAALVHDYPAPGEMLSQLCLVAQGPTKTNRFQSAVIGFFISWRDSQVSESLEDKKPPNLIQNEMGLKRVAGLDLVSMEAKSDYIQDSYWSDVIFEESPKKVIPSRGRKRKAKSKMNRARKKKAAERSVLSSSLEPPLNESELLSDCSAILQNKQQQEEMPENLSDNKAVEECDPAALILNFSDPNALPSMSNLIMIFSQFGPLKKSDTEVSRKSKRASVVFKRGADAEVAFSSAGKYNAFGPALVSYKLVYLTSTSPDTTPKKDPSLKEGATSSLPDSAVVLTGGECS